MTTVVARIEFSVEAGTDPDKFAEKLAEFLLNAEEPVEGLPSYMSVDSWSGYTL